MGGDQLKIKGTRLYKKELTAKQRKKLEEKEKKKVVLCVKQEVR